MSSDSGIREAVANARKNRNQGGSTKSTFVSGDTTQGDVQSTPDQEQPPEDDQKTDQ